MYLWQIVTNLVFMSSIVQNSYYFLINLNHNLNWKLDFEACVTYVHKYLICLKNTSKKHKLIKSLSVKESY